MIQRSLSRIIRGKREARDGRVIGYDRTNLHPERAVQTLRIQEP